MGLSKYGLISTLSGLYVIIRVVTLMVTLVLVTMFHPPLSRE